MAAIAEVRRPIFDIPGPQPTRWLGRTGNVLAFANDPLNYLADLFQTYGPVASLVAGGRTRLIAPSADCPGSVFVHGADLNREVLTLPGVYHKSAIGGVEEQQRTRLTDDEVVGHAGIIFMAGHETSANALTWTLLLLSQHPAIAADLLDELSGVLKGDPPTIEQIAQLPLLDRVVKESLRLLPPVPMNHRILAESAKLGGYWIPAGSEVFVSIYHIHHDPTLYSQPQKFDPDRWLNISPTAFEYNPFSAGPRMCIGAPFAQLEIKVVLATLLQRFRLEFIPSTQLDRRVRITMAPLHGLPMLVRNQDRQFARGVGGMRGNVRDMVDWPHQ